MLGIGLPEVLLTLCLGVIFIGPKEIPSAVYSLLKFIRKIKTMSSSINKSVEVFIAETELNAIVDEAVFIDESKDLEAEINDKVIKND